MAGIRQCFSLLLLCSEASQAPGAEQVIRLKEYLGHTFTDELIGYPLDAGLRDAASVQVVDETGASLPCQSVDGRIYLLVSLPADSERIFTVRPGQPAAADRAVRVAENGACDQFLSGPNHQYVPVPV